jgi:hypothetical protein
VASATPAPATAPPAAPPEDPSRLYGVTVDDVENLGATVAALSALPKKATTRIVFATDLRPDDYHDAVPAIHAVSNVMGLVLDSSSMADVSTSSFVDRTNAFLSAFSGSVDVWEVGNEINGNWLGATPDVVAKMTSAYDITVAAGRKTALTLFACSDSDDEHDMFNWVDANVPDRMRGGLDYVLLSYYEGDCGNPRDDWQAVFDRLRQIFPKAGLGFGEVGAVNLGNDVHSVAVAGPYLQKYYGMQITTPGFVGGYFWWYFAEDMIPMNKGLYPILSAALRAMP